ncbi:MAG: DUF3299 domain-containing protein [Bacteroidota bacterium]
MKQLLLIYLLFITTTLIGQTSIDWVNLADVTFVEKPMEEIGILYNEATFGEDLLALADTEVSITGFVIPMDSMGISFVLSRNPNASCFFCGGAGPETVIQIQPKKIKHYQTDEFLTFKGILRLNEKDIESLTYVLEEAEEL